MKLYYLLPCIMLLALVLLGRASRQPELTAIETEGTAVSAPAANAGNRNWIEAYNKGLELTKAGNLTEASYYFSNALGADPGNYGVIEAYCKTMLELSKSENKQDHAGYDVSTLQILEGFLQSQIPLVKYDEVAKILGTLKDLRAKMEMSQDVPTPARPEFDKVIAEIVQGKRNFPKTDESLYAEQESLIELKEYATARNVELDKIQKIDTLLDRVQKSMEYRVLAELLKMRKNMVEESCKTSASIAEYQLQECEQCLREMIALGANDHADGIKEELKKLKELARKVIDAKGNEIWEETLVRLKDLATKRESISGSESEQGEIQRKLEILQEEAMFLQNMISGLTVSALEEAIQYRKDLEQEATALTNAQSKQYNYWAMEQIKTCLKEAGEGKGYFANGADGRRKISQALISRLGPIDRRFLTSEVSRCLDEVQNKYLTGQQLNPVKDEKSIYDDGNILYTLNNMYETTKRTQSEF